MAFNPRLLIPLSIVALLTVGGIVLDRQRESKRSSLSGVFEAQPTKVSSRLGGRVAHIKVKEGDSVRKGQVLLEFEADSARFDSAAVSALAEEAQARRALATNGPRTEDIVRQRAIVSELKANLQKLRNGSLPEEIGIARQRLAEAQARLDLANNGPKDEDIRAARAAEQEAFARLQQAERGLTQEERIQIQARYDSARADAENARRDATRVQRLFEQGASSQREAEVALTLAAQAEARLRDASAALIRATQGTPPEELDQARKAHDRAQAQYEGVKSGTRPEDISVLRAQRDSARENLALVKRGPRAEDISAAASRVSQASATLQALERGTRPEELAQADAAARAAESQADSSKARLSEQVIVAPADGLVERILIADGDLVEVGQPVIQLNDPKDIWLRVYLSEIGLGKVKVGDSAELLVDGIDQPVAGQVEAIASQGEFTPANLQTPEERGKQVFAVRVRLKQPDSRIKAGMAVTVKKLGLWP